MSRVTQAYSAHAALSVNGVKIYDLFDTPSAAQAIWKVQSGTSVLFPIFDGMELKFNSPHDLDYGDEGFTARFQLLIAPSWGVEGAWVVGRPAVERLDAYLTAMARNPDLRTDVDDPETATLENRAEVSARTAPRKIGEDWWYMAEITHLWRFHVEDEE